MITPKNLAAIRRSLSLKQADLAKMAGVSQCEISRIERGKRSPRYETLESIEKALRSRGLIQDEIFQFDDVATREKKIFRIIHSQVVIGKDGKRYTVKLADNGDLLIIFKGGKQ